MQLFTLSEFKKLPVGEWIECADGLRGRLALTLF